MIDEENKWARIFGILIKFHIDFFLVIPPTPGVNLTRKWPRYLFNSYR